nr:helix-turn-helix transcriptional regulator [uncultured Ruegeria sp.]
MALDHKLLKETLKSRKLTQSLIEDWTGKNIRTVRRWLSGQNQPGEEDIRTIASKLNIEPEKLDPRLEEQSAGKIQVSARLSVSSHNAYQILKNRYGVSQTEVIELAPIMFAAIAKFSDTLARQEASELEKASQRYPIDPSSVQHVAVELAFAESGLIFGTDSETGDYLDCIGVGNPFANCIDYLAGGSSRTRVTPLGECPGSKDFVVDETALLELTSGDKELATAIADGKIRLDLMHKDLWNENRTDERLKWLKDNLPPKADMKKFIERFKDRDPKAAATFENLLFEEGDEG